MTAVTWTNESDICIVTIDNPPVNDADLVIEAVFDDLGVKQEVFKVLDRTTKASAVLAAYRRVWSSC